MDKELIALGERIKILRNKKKLTQEELAELTGYSTNHISKLESARTNPSFDLIIKIANALKVEPKELFRFDEYKKIDSIKRELNSIIKNSEDSKIHLLYKIFKAID